MMTLAEIDLLAAALAERLAGRVADGNELIDIHGAAELLKCSVPTIERRVADGKIPSIKIGRLRRFRRADLLNLSGGNGGLQ